jgi:Fur family ferric uptake transcriptional regulator
VAYAAAALAIAEEERAHASVTLTAAEGGAAAEEHAASSATLATTRVRRVRRRLYMTVSDWRRDEAARRIVGCDPVRGDGPNGSKRRPIETASHSDRDRVSFGGMPDPTLLEMTIESAGRRLTRPRRAVAALIDARDGAFSAADLVADARGQRLGIGRATIFRAIELLAEIGALERIDLPTGDHAYVPCGPAHHHHVVCRRCSRSVEIGDLGLAALARDIARKTGYRIDEHRLELFGLCPDCRRVGASA